MTVAVQARSRVAVVTSLGLPLTGVAVFFAVWWLLTDVCHPGGAFLARFSLMRSLAAFAHLALSGELWPHVTASVRRIAVGLTLSVVLGFPLGVAIGMLPRFRAATAPVFHLIRMVSPLSWTPLAIMLFGVGDSPVYFLVAMAGMWPIVLSTSAAIAAIDPRLLLVGRSLGGSPLELAWTIAWPHIRPQVTTGVRVSIGLGWVVLVPAEMLGVDSGLGYLVLTTRDRLAYSELGAVILVTGLLGVLIDQLARRLLA